MHSIALPLHSFIIAGVRKRSQFCDLYNSINEPSATGDTASTLPLRTGTTGLCIRIAIWTGEVIITIYIGASCYSRNQRLSR